MARASHFERIPLRERPDLITEIRRQAAEGRPMRDIARSVGLSMTAVNYASFSPFYGVENLQPSRRKATDASVDVVRSILARRAAGQTYEEIARALGYNTAVQMWTKSALSVAARELYDRGELEYGPQGPQLVDIPIERITLIGSTRDLLNRPERWCKHFEAWSRFGLAVPPFDDSAVAFSVFGAMQRVIYIEEQSGRTDRADEWSVEAEGPTHDAMMAAVDGLQWCGLDADHECDIDCWAAQDHVDFNDVRSMLMNTEELLR